MTDPYRLTPYQFETLLNLPIPPKAKLCKGPQLRAALRLLDCGFVEKTDQASGAYFVRTEAGQAYISTEAPYWTRPFPPTLSSLPWI